LALAGSLGRADFAKRSEVKWARPDAIRASKLTQRDA